MGTPHSILGNAGEHPGAADQIWSFTPLSSLGWFALAFLFSDIAELHLYSLQLCQLLSGMLLAMKLGVFPLIRNAAQSSLALPVTSAGLHGR